MKTTAWRYALAAAVAVGAGSIGQTEADTVVYATGSSAVGSPSTFGTLDLTTGQFTAIAGLGQSMVSLTAGPGGTLYASAMSGNLYTITTSGVEAQFGSVSAPIGFWGLADAGSTGIYALDPSGNPNGITTVLDKIAPDGNSLTRIGPLPTYEGSGDLAFGPGGLLYTLSFTSSGVLQLYSVAPASGAVTAIGSGMTTFGNDGLTLVYAGGQLYGIDTYEVSGFAPINIYTIDTTTGVATATGVTVSGLPSEYFLDTAAALPEPSTLTMALIGAVTGLGVIWRRRRKA